MECSIGLVLEQGVLMAADCHRYKSLLCMNADYNKIKSLDDHSLMTVLGDPGDVYSFGDYIHKNCKLYRISNGYELSTKGAAQFVRSSLGEYLRSNTPKNVYVLIGGYDILLKKPKLFFMDPLASFVELPFAVQGIGGLLCLSIIDSNYRPNMTVQEAYNLLEECILLCHERLVINLSNFQVQMVTKKGITTLPAIKIENLLSTYKKRARATLSSASEDLLF